MTARPQARLGGPVGLVAGLLAALLLPLAGPVPASAEPSPAARQPGDRQVTLVTGDRVTLRGGDPARPVITPAPGRERVPLRTHRIGPHLYVFPADVAAEVATGRLDRRLFDVTGIADPPAGLARADGGVLLTIRQIGPDGRPAAGQTAIYGIDTGGYEFVGDPGGTTRIRLPRGEYLLDGTQAVPRPGNDAADYYSIVRPSLRLTGDTTVVLDARTTRDVRLTVPAPDAGTAFAAVGYRRSDSTGGFEVTQQLDDFGFLHTAQTGPSVPADRMTGYLAGQWARRSGGSFAGSPYLYATLDTFPGGFPTGFVRRVERRDLAVVEQTANAVSERTAGSAVFGSRGPLRMAWAADLTYRPPARRRLLLDAKASWHTEWYETVLDPDTGEQTDLTTVRTRPRTYRAGRLHRERFNAAVIAPPAPRAERFGEALAVALDPGRSPDSPLAPAVDADGNALGTRADREWSRLERDGVPVASSERFGELRADELPAGPARYTLSTSLSRRTYADVSTRLECVWTFVSASTGGVEPLPLLAVRYRPDVDGENRGTRRGLTVVPFAIVAPPGTELPQLRSVRLEVSGDGGRSWRPATVAPAGRRGFRAVFGRPAGPTVSLRATLVDAAGHRTRQTVIDAFR